MPCVFCRKVPTHSHFLRDLPQIRHETRRQISQAGQKETAANRPLSAETGWYERLTSVAQRFSDLHTGLVKMRNGAAAGGESTRSRRPEPVLV